MQKKRKYFWMYTIVLFSVALVLILFSAFSVTSRNEIENENKKKIQSVGASVRQLEDENEALKTENTRLKEENGSLKGEKQAAENILTAEALYAEGKYTEAKAEIEKVDAESISGKLLEKYDVIKNKINSKN